LCEKVGRIVPCPFPSVPLLGSVQVQQIGFLSHWDPYAVLSPEVVAYSSYCNAVEWFWWDGMPAQWPTGFLRGFVGWLGRALEMTYKVSSSTLSLDSQSAPFGRLILTLTPFSRRRPGGVI